MLLGGVTSWLVLKEPMIKSLLAIAANIGLINKKQFNEKNRMYISQD
jgi:hypothetical protein